MSRRGWRLEYDGEEPSTAAAAPAVVDHAECTGRSCRSCAAVMVADCIALGCCPCAVVSLLGLALVKAPLAMGRRCVGRLRRRKARARHKQRVRDEAVGGKCTGFPEEAKKCDGVETDAGEVAHRVSTSALDAEKMWLELYQVGHWGFGRVSFSANPVKAA